MIWWAGLAPWKFEFLLSGSLYLHSWGETSCPPQDTTQSERYIDSGSTVNFWGTSRAGHRLQSPRCAQGTSWALQDINSVEQAASRTLSAHRQRACALQACALFVFARLLPRGQIFLKKVRSGAVLRNATPEKWPTGIPCRCPRVF